MDRITDKSKSELNNSWFDRWVLLGIIFGVLFTLWLSSCEKANQCWECEIKYLDLKTQKLLLTDKPLDICGVSRDSTKKLEFNGSFTHPQLGIVRKLEYCELAQ